MQDAAPGASQRDGAALPAERVLSPCTRKVRLRPTPGRHRPRREAVSGSGGRAPGPECPRSPARAPIGPGHLSWEREAQRSLRQLPPGAARPRLTLALPPGAHPVARPQEHWLERLHRLQVALDPPAEDGLHEVRVLGGTDAPPGDLRA